MNKSVPISFIVPVKNEEHNLRKSLPSIDWADEIFVVDSNSSDATVEVAESFGANVVQFKFNGTWPKKKNWSLENLPFRNEWIFILDADEVLPPEAEEELRMIVKDSKHPCDGYWINRRFMFMGKWLKHAYFPNWNLRFFKHRLGRYEQLTESDTQSGDNEVHEHVIVKGKTGKLQCLMDHYAFPDVSTFIEKHNRYSNWEAIAQVEGSGRESKLQSGRVKMRRKLKSWFQKAPFRPFLRFCYVYVFQKGFLDGIEGYHFARLHGVYEYLSIAKTYEIRKKRNSHSPD